MFSDWDGVGSVDCLSRSVSSSTSFWKVIGSMVQPLERGKGQPKLSKENKILA
jgi:hypothetical protein